MNRQIKANRIDIYLVLLNQEDGLALTFECS